MPLYTLTLHSPYTNTHRHTDTQTHKHTNTDTQTQTKTDTQTQTDTHRQTDKQADKETDTRDRETNKQRETKKDTDRKTETKRHTLSARSAPDSDVDMPKASPAHVHASDSEARAGSRLRMPQLHAAAGCLSPSALAQWSEPVGNGLSRACLGAAPPLSLPSTTAVFWPAARRWLQMFGGPLWTGHPGLLPARFGLVVWIGILEVRGWFPIQLQHDPGVQAPNHQSKPAIRGKLRRVPKKGRALRGRDRCVKNRAIFIEPAPAKLFCNSGTNIFYHLICIKSVYSSHAKSMLPVSNTGRETH